MPYVVHSMRASAKAWERVQKRKRESERKNETKVGFARTHSKMISSFLHNLNIFDFPRMKRLFPIVKLREYIPFLWFTFTLAYIHSIDSMNFILTRSKCFWFLFIFFLFLFLILYSSILASLCWMKHDENIKMTRKCEKQEATR